MTATTTQSEILSEYDDPGFDPDSPAVSTRARARIPVTDSDANRETPRLGFVTRWWAWTARPDSYGDTWAASRVITARIPGASRPLRAVWRLSNCTDRLLMFALILAAPTFLQGPLRWTVQRPTRRYGLYFTLTVLATCYLLGRSSS